jgi:hypothetical protein
VTDRAASTLNRLLLAWAAEERGLDVDRVAEFVEASGCWQRSLAFPILPVALVQQVLRDRWEPASATSPVTTTPQTRAGVQEWVAKLLMGAISVPRTPPYGDGDELAAVREVIAHIGARCSDPATPLHHRLALADTAIARHCLNEVDVLMLGGHATHPLLRDLSQRSALPAFISAKSHDPAVLGVTGNPGDAFAIPVVRHLSGREVSPRGVWADPEEPLVFSVGSVLHHVRDRGVTWGTGAITGLATLPPARTTPSLILGVRGPRTRDVVVMCWGQNPAVVSDPGLLLPRVFDVPTNDPDIDVGFLPHGVDRQDIVERFPQAFTITNYHGFGPLIAGIQRCRRIVASSLHGMIFAHALGRPVTLINVADRLTGGDFKFVDYLASMGRYDPAPRQHVDFLDQAPSISFPSDAVHAAQDWLVASFPFPSEQ